MIILDIRIQFSKETEFLLNKNFQYSYVLDIMIFCRVTEDIIISRLDCPHYNYYTLVINCITRRLVITG